MERSTTVGGNGTAYCNCPLDCYAGCQKILKRLADYEDTGLTPEEVAELVHGLHASKNESAGTENG